MLKIFPQTIFLLLFLAQSAFAAQLCKPCPEGCVPEAIVEETGDIPQGHDCGEGCLPFAAVKKLKLPQPCQPQVATSEAKEEASAEADLSDAQKENQNDTVYRLIFNPTARTLKKGKAVVTGYAIAAWEFQYGVTDNLQLGAYTVFPVTWAGIAPSLRYSCEVTKDKLYFQFGPTGGIVGVYDDGVGFNTGEFIWFAGGGFAFSRVWDKHLLNFGITAVTGGQRESQSGGMKSYQVKGAYLLANIGYRYGFHRNWAFILEFTPLILAGNYERPMLLMDQDRIWTLVYGFRGHGELLFGDLGFMLPFCDDFVDEVWKYVPFGFPYFSLGFKF